MFRDMMHISSYQIMKHIIYYIECIIIILLISKSIISILHIKSYYISNDLIHHILLKIFSIIKTYISIKYDIVEPVSLLSSASSSFSNGSHFGPATQARGKSMEDFVERHQDKSKNALQKSMEAAFNSWVEELKADQAQFQADKILTLDFCFINLFVPSISKLRMKTCRRRGYVT